ncbi:RsmE family RNA methyltransferase [Fodinibius sediminis]|uniref:Ribosomal RNA small subunit methyltransferase E n=1 Tax=Fodinibius sediminis TaxID=1214077 RepID=A0A521DTE8_9BACT|nr:16S rRNA (uracil(1498)-N(3))-methyltransferase [Fodinibius sediminis]SMO74898.1 16S rRNA (uracil1498-N3)-methyltransferase [Fodinibius sediminis]
MNIFYAPPSHINGNIAELEGQEARHASRVLRAREGDYLTIVDGRGGRYKGPIQRISRKSVQIRLEKREQVSDPGPELILGMGIIKKRDRLEFAVEKAVELGARHLALFRSEHTVKKNVRSDRLEAIMLSAMKQSLRSWLPSLMVFNSVEEVMRHYQDARCLMAHEKADREAGVDNLAAAGEKRLLLLTGPEGGFSPEEVERAVESGAELVSLGEYRLRAETAAVTLMSQFIDR